MIVVTICGSIEFSGEFAISLVAFELVFVFVDLEAGDEVLEAGDAVLERVVGVVGLVVLVGVEGGVAMGELASGFLVAAFLCVVEESGASTRMRFPTAVGFSTVVAIKIRRSTRERKVIKRFGRNNKVFQL